MPKRQDNSFGILMYHRVAPWTDGVPEPTWNVTPERFRRQLAGLLSRGYRPWPLRRALAYRQAGKPFPARMFVVTFDDGYDNIYHHAWPILKELSIPATVFVVTDYLDADRPFACDDWAAAGSATVPANAWQPLSTAHCAEMIEHGLVEIGSHTHTHGLFCGRSEVFHTDLARSLEVLHNSLGVERASFAFPFGCYDHELAAAAHRTGVICALTTDQEPVRPNADPFAWGRFMAAQGDTAATLALKLGGWYTILRRAWQWLQRPQRASQGLFSRREDSTPPITTEASAHGSEAVTP